MEDLRFPFRLTFYKKGEMIYYSQLDLFHLLEKALRRSGLPLHFTKGFHPHVKISFPYALKLGVEGKIDATLYFSREILPAEIRANLIPELPQGLEIIEITKS